MITVIPGLDVMNAVTDKNLNSAPSEIRRIAFDKANEIKSLGDIDILLEGLLFKKVKERLNPDHITFFESAYRIDKSAEGVEGYNITKAISWVAKSESKSRMVIIVTDSVGAYSSLNDSVIKIVTPAVFIDKVQRAIIYYNRKVFTSIEDSLVATFFL